MAIYRGPNTVNKNLVFGMDNGYGVADNDTSTRHAQGKPTTNMASIDLADWGIESGAARNATGNYYKGQPTYNCRSAVGSSWLAIYQTISGLRTAAGSSGTVTMSLWVRNNFNAQFDCYAYMGHDFGSTRTIAAHADWQRIQWTVNQSSMSSDYMEFRPYTNNTNIYLECTMPQIEVNVGTATPWVDGERSNTESIIDLKSSVDLSAANVSFDSSGLVTFDGTDDYINVDKDFGDFNEYTIEYVVNTTTNGKMPIAGRTNTNFYKYGAYSWRYKHGGTLGEYYHTGGTVTGWSHWLITYDGDLIKVFQNNVSLGTNGASSGGADFSDGFKIGSWASASSYSFNGDIPIMRVYDRALTSAEIEQNFKIYKKRFNI